MTPTTAIFRALVRHPGYRTQITMLSVPVTYASLKNYDIDVFLGNWMPSMEGDRRSYVQDGSVEVVRHNLPGAKYTLAVPAYSYESGLRTFADVHRFALSSTTRSTASSRATTAISWWLGMLRQNRFGLGDVRLIKSSEPAMLAELELVERPAGGYVAEFVRM